MTPTASLLHVAAAQASPGQSRHTGAGLLTPTSPTDKQGSPWVRWVLAEAAHKAKSRPPFAHFYAQCAARRGPKIATVAVARKLLARGFHVLKQVDAASQPSEKVTQPGALGLHAAPATRPKF